MGKPGSNAKGKGKVVPPNASSSSSSFFFNEEKFAPSLADDLITATTTLPLAFWDELDKRLDDRKVPPAPMARNLPPHTDPPHPPQFFVGPPPRGQAERRLNQRSPLLLRPSPRQPEDGARRLAPAHPDALQARGAGGPNSHIHTGFQA